MSFRKYELGSYEEMVANHSWDVPERYNIAEDVCDKHDRDRLAMVWEDYQGTERRVTFGELQDLSNKFANVLEAEGVEREDRVATLLPSLPETAAVFIGTYKSGAILLSMSVLYGDDGIEHRLRDSGAKVLVTDTENVERIPEGIVETVLVMGDGFEEKMENASAEYERADTAADDPAQLYYSSGTTGKAKGILHAHRYLLAHEEFEFCHDVRDGELFHGMGEWAWAAGICPLLGPWRYGCVALVFARKGGFDPDEQLRFLSKHGVQNMFTTPTALRAMTGVEDAGKQYPLSELRVVCSAGEPLNPEVIRWFRDQYGLTVLDYYGLTESYPLCGNFPGRRGPRGLHGPADARLGCEAARRGRERGAGGRARRDLPEGPLQPALPDRLLEPARGHRGGVRRRVVPHQGRRPARRGRLRLVRRPRRRRDHLRRLPHRPVRGGVGLR